MLLLKSKTLRVISQGNNFKFVFTYTLLSINFNINCGMRPLIADPKTKRLIFFLPSFLPWKEKKRPRLR